MLFYFGSYFQRFFGPARLFQSYTVLIALALYSSFFVTLNLLPLFYNILPHDRGREYALTAEAAKGKPTGAGAVFITIYALICILFVPMGLVQAGILLLTWLTMLTGFLDDYSAVSWGEYRKGALDLLVSAAGAVVLYYRAKGEGATASVWLPFVTHPVSLSAAVYIAISVILLWASINTTNCTDGIDGLSGTLVLVALLTLGFIFYFILGHKDIAAYLLVPHIADGAKWALMAFALSGVLMGYLWHNAFPSSVLMGDAGSRALGFAIGAGVLACGNPIMIFATSFIIFVNGGVGLLKLALLRFFHIKIFKNIRFPLHDHMRKNCGWSETQVLLKFLIVQMLITTALVGLFFKVR